jgi:hypothetical protein
MLSKRHKPQIARPAIEDLATRRARHAIEAPKAMKDYRDAQQAVYQRTAALREQRLARQIKDSA